MRLIHKKTISYFIITLLLTPVVSHLFFAILNSFHQNPQQSAFGYNISAGTAENMYPTFRLGDIFIMHLCRPEEVQVGDIISVNPYSQYTLTSYQSIVRVVKILPELDGQPGLWFVTKDDADEDNHEPISANQFYGKITGRIPWIGKLFDVSSTRLFLRYLFFWGIAILVIFLRHRAKKA